ncbi:MAG TPA: GntG family PLP-dependent aldolase [Flavobacteriales bacterium]|nr:PLP-dependent transferase [Flavobacteriales bacterium]HQW85899.1 GntG family PLP-dependent aldolase [Flavobacteriales bacterium]
MTAPLIDLRSDTVTRPTPAMREAMLRAEVGDDVFGEDPMVNALEERMAALFGHEAAVFCPSGTMTNQIAIHVHTRPGDEVICEEGAHVYRYEGGGMMATSGCSVKHVAADRGRYTAEAVAAAVNDRNAAYLANSRLVVVENTTNRGGGAIWDLAEVGRIRAVCDAQDLRLHLDGARLFNAMAVDGTTPAQWGGLFHSISICLSKGLGAPAGSVLIGPSPLIHQARRVRKRLGGGMRQAGFLAAAGLYALEHHVARLPEDHRRARRIGTALSGHAHVEEVMPVVTNIVIYSLRTGHSAIDHVAALASAGVRCMAIGPRQVRMVTHLDVDDAAVDRVLERLRSMAD